MTKKMGLMALGLSMVLLSGCGSSDNDAVTNPTPPPVETPDPTPPISNSDYILKVAFENKQNNLQVNGIGSTKRLLSDDNTGSRHQRFILELSSGQTLLISHNIDLAAKIDTLQINDIVEFYGVYEWNEEGGVVHWTHDDPNGTHINGWLKHNGIIYY